MVASLGRSYFLNIVGRILGPSDAASKWRTNSVSFAGTCIKLAIALSVSADTLVFDQNERGPDDDLRLQFEATTRLTDDEKHIVKTIIESIILNHEAKRWAA